MMVGEGLYALGVLSDVDGAIGKVFLRGSLFSIGKTVLADLAVALPNAKFNVLLGKGYNSDVHSGGVLVDDGGRVPWILPPFLTDDYGDAGFTTAVAFEEWMNAHLPFGLHFRRVDYVTREPDVLSNLDVAGLISACWKYRTDFPIYECKLKEDTNQPYWKSTGNGTHIELHYETFGSASIAMQIDDKVLSKRVAALNRYREWVDAKRLYWDVRFADRQDELAAMRKVKLCRSGQADSGCVVNRSIDLGSWFQDSLVVRRSTALPYIFLRSGGDNPSRTLDYCRAVFPENEEFIWGGEDILDIKGGNMHVCGELAFVGKDEHERYPKDSLGRADAGLIFGPHGSGHIIWIGHSVKLPSIIHNDPDSFQPLFHTDMFFCPLALRNVDGRSTLTFIYGKPELEDFIGLNETETPLIVVRTVIRFQETLERLKASLSALDIASDPIVIPFPLEFINHGRNPPNIVDWSRPVALGNCWSWANGLVENKDEQTVFLMPCYKLLSGNVDRIKVAQVIAHDAISKRAQVKCVHGSELDSGVKTKGSLRCLVKVIARS